MISTETTIASEQLHADLFNSDLLQADKLARQCPIQALSWSRLNDLGLELYIKREDLLDSAISGNKLYKLVGHLQRAKLAGAKRLVSFGGYYSNHIHALAAAAHRLNWPVTAVIRGEQPVEMNATLKDCCAWGMELMFVSRGLYRNKHQADELRELLTTIASQEGLDPREIYVIPEGGSGEAGLTGCEVLGRAIAEWSHQTLSSSDHLSVCMPCGTGTTMAGIRLGISDAMANHSSSNVDCHGIVALKTPSSIASEDTLAQQIDALLKDHGRSAEYCQGTLHTDFHCGGYAKVNDELLALMDGFEHETGIPLDPVYTGKMLLGVLRLAEQGFWPKERKLLLLHTGGLQGRRGFSHFTKA